MFQNRKELRKSFTSSGQLYISGELLSFRSCDISVKGISIEIIPGYLLVELSDFEALLMENNSAEIYVKNLMLTSETKIAWVKMSNGKVMLGLEFRNVTYNARQLWRKRQYYRSKRQFFGHLMADDKRLNFKGIDVSADGASMQLEQHDDFFKSGNVVKIMVDDLEVTSIGKIIWINKLVDEDCILGLRYLIME